MLYLRCRLNIRSCGGSVGNQTGARRIGLWASAVSGTAAVSECRQQIQEIQKLPHVCDDAALPVPDEGNLVPHIPVHVLILRPLHNLCANTW